MREQTVTVRWLYNGRWPLQSSINIFQWRI